MRLSCSFVSLGLRGLALMSVAVAITQSATPQAISVITAESDSAEKQAVPQAKVKSLEELRKPATEFKEAYPNNAVNALARYFPMQVGNVWEYRATVATGSYHLIAWRTGGPVLLIRDRTSARKVEIRSANETPGTTGKAKYSLGGDKSWEVTYGESVRVVEVERDEYRRTVYFSDPDPKGTLVETNNDLKVTFSRDGRPYEVEVAAGKFSDCIEITEEMPGMPGEAEGFRSRSYYAPGVGLVLQYQSDLAGHPTAYIELTRYSDKDSDVSGQETKAPAPESLSSLRGRAEQGDAAAQFNLGNRYDNGQGVPQDYAEAVRWFRKAAEQGYAPGQGILGIMYRAGTGVPQDYNEAVRWYRKAAERGYAPGQELLGTMYRDGTGVPQDYREAVRWFLQAAEQGDDDAQFNLGNMYFDGRGVPQDYAEAVRWYQKAADQGVPEAQFNLGLMYERGRGVPRDSVEAYMRMSLAVSLATGDVQKKFAEERALVAKKMTAKQIVEAQLRARGWKPKTAQESTESTQK